MSTEEPTLTDAWGQPSSAERQAELQGYLDRWDAETAYGNRRGPFDRGISQDQAPRLTGADVFWLAERVRDENDWVPRLQLQGADLSGVQLQEARLRKAQFQGANLYRAQLQGCILQEAQLQDANLIEARMEHALLHSAQLQGASLSNARLQGVQSCKAPTSAMHSYRAPT
jgi:hypothetical protein